jgi:hypothetical protein
MATWCRRATAGPTRPTAPRSSTASSTAAPRPSARATSPPTPSRCARSKALGLPLKGAVELHFTYDEEFGGELGPGWLLNNGLTKPDYLIAAGFSYQVVTAHNGCLQLEVTLHGLASHAAYPHTGVDALQAATRSC